MLKLPLGQFRMQTKILALPLEAVMANCEMFVNPEPLNRRLLGKCAVLVSLQHVVCLGVQSMSPFTMTCLDF